MKTNYYIAAKFSTLLLLLLAACFCMPQKACAQKGKEYYCVKVTVKLYAEDHNGNIVQQVLDPEDFGFFMQNVEITNLRTKIVVHPNEDGTKYIGVRRKDKLRVRALGYRTCEVKVGKKMGEIEARLVSLGLDCLQDEVIIPMSSPKK